MLPIEMYKDKIINIVNSNKVTIITAETGAGKSTQVPQYLLEAGYRVVVTEPRRLAAMSLAKRVSDEMKSPVGNQIGYHTGKGSNFSKDTKCLYCTDGLELIKQFSDQKRDLSGTVLIIDEVHEWNLNEEVLVGWCKANLNTDFFDKIIIMSATMESEKLSKFFNNAPIIQVPGTLYDVTSCEREKNDLIVTINDLVNRGKNSLVFVPGKYEINRTMQDLQKLNINAEILPLHAEISPEEQQKCFRSYSRPKVILATTIAQTSITIPDIDAVVDTGLERRTETINGVEGLYTRDISKADVRQRKGRAGRTKNGEYYLCSDVSYKDRGEYTPAEINRLRLDQVVLRLLIYGIDMEAIEFFHQPEPEKIKRAKETLYNLDLVRFGKVTENGILAAKLPLSVKSSTMLIEGIKRNVANEMITIAAIFEVGSLLNRYALNEVIKKSFRDELSFDEGYGWFTRERESDLIAEMDIYNYIQEGIKNKTPNLFEKISTKNYWDVHNLRNKLLKDLEFLSGKNSFFTIGKSTGARDDIIFSIFSGLKEDIFEQKEEMVMGYYKGVYDENDDRKLSIESCIRINDNFRSLNKYDWDYETKKDKRVKYVIGKPFNGPQNSILTMASIINESFLNYAPKALLIDPQVRNGFYDQNDSKNPHKYKYWGYQNLKRYEPTTHEAWTETIGYLEGIKKAVVFYKWLAEIILSEEEFKTANEALNMAINYDQRLLKSDKDLQVFTSLPVLFEFIYYKLNGIDIIADVDEKSADSLKIKKL